MNIGRANTPPIFIARGIRPWTGVWGHTVNIGRVYTPLIFIARGIHPSTGGIGAHNEYWKGVQVSNIHVEGYTHLDTGYRGTR